MIERKIAQNQPNWEKWFCGTLESHFKNLSFQISKNSAIFTKVKEKQIYR